MLQFLIGWCRLRWTRSERMFHPLPDHISREFVNTDLGAIELLVSQPRPRSQKPGHPPVLFVHGGFGHASVWLEWMTYLSTHYNAPTYAISIRNHGASYVCSSFFRMAYQTRLEDLVTDVVAAVNEVEKREGTAPILVVHSAGATLTQYMLSKAMATTPALALVGSVPHYGFVAPMWNWCTRLDPWMFVMGAFMFHHPRALLCTTMLVRNAFFGPDYPYEKFKDFEKWMAPYESICWPMDAMGSHENGRNVWLDTNKIVPNITTYDPSKDKVLIMLGTEDHLMQGTQERMVAEYADAILKLDETKKILVEGKPRSHPGVRLVEIDRAGHHLRNDVQWEEGARALLDFLLQV